MKENTMKKTPDAVVKEIRTLLENFLDRFGHDEYMKFQDQLKVFISVLKAKYGQKVQYCRMYHVAIFSGPPENCELFDFPGEDSIEGFVRRKIV